jgi:hypothetical protein
LFRFLWITNALAYIFTLLSVNTAPVLKRVTKWNYFISVPQKCIGLVTCMVVCPILTFQWSSSLHNYCTQIFASANSAKYINISWHHISNHLLLKQLLALNKREAEFLLPCVNVQIQKVQQISEHTAVTSIPIVNFKYQIWKLIRMKTGELQLWQTYNSIFFTKQNSVRSIHAIALHHGTCFFFHLEFYCVRKLYIYKCCHHCSILLWWGTKKTLNINSCERNVPTTIP